MPTNIKGQPTSGEIVKRLRALDEPVLLSFSCGKDSIAAWIALESAGIEVVPCYMWLVPNLNFVNKELEYFENVFDKKIHRYPHASFYRLMAGRVFQPPERLRCLEAARLPEPSYQEIWSLIRKDLSMEGAWCADGVRAADSIVRRASFVKHGVMKPNNMKVSPIADWLKAEVVGTIAEAGIELPIDYRIWGRSFDGIDRRFTEPMKEFLPDDYATLLEWFPLIEADIARCAEYGI